MNPWELVSFVAGWGAFVILVFILGAIFFGIIRWFAKELKEIKAARARRNNQNHHL